MISVIIPCYDEEKNIGKVIDDIRRYLHLENEVIVVDNNSKDKTSEVAKKRKAKVEFEEKKGKGNAIIRGAKKANGNILIFIDGDNSYSGKFIQDIIKPIEKGEAQIVYGSRFLKDSRTKISFLRFFGNKIFSLLGFLFYGKKVDFLTGLFAIKKDKFLDLNLKSAGFEIETEIFKKAIKRNLKIKEVPIEYKANNDSKIKPIKDGFKILRTLIFTK